MNICLIRNKTNLRKLNKLFNLEEQLLYKLKYTRITFIFSIIEFAYNNQYFSLKQLHSKII